MKINRAEFYKRLLAVSPGLSTGKDPIQGDCYIFRRGYVYTLNDEIACAIKTGLDPGLDFVVRASTLFDLVKSLKEAEIEIAIEGRLIVEGKNGRKAKLNLEAEAFLGVDAVERPKEWKVLEDGFAEAIDLVCRCTNRKADEFGFKCVHITPLWIEATDNNKMARWNVRSFVRSGCLIRGTTAAQIVPLGLTKGCETENWLHFKNPFGLRISLHKWDSCNYTDLSDFLKMRGNVVKFPKFVGEAAKRAGLFLDNKDGSVKVELSRNQIVLTGDGQDGEYEEPVTTEYRGPEFKFSIPPKLLSELSEIETTCEVSDVTLRVEKHPYVYVTGLEAVR